MAVEVLEWAHEEARFVLEGRLLVAQPTDNNWRRGRTVKLAPVIAMLVTNGKVNKLFFFFISQLQVSISRCVIIDRNYFLLSSSPIRSLSI